MSFSIATSLANKTVLITGVSGFLGKVVLERLLSEGPKDLKIKLLLRGSSKFSDPQQRFEQEVLSSSIFDNLREKGDLEKRLVAVSCVAGELTQPMLGMGAEAFEALGSELDLIINSAASVNFREALDQALLINTLSLKSLMSLSEVNGRCKFLQVSTCYVHGKRPGVIFEQNNAPVGDAGVEARPGGRFDVDALMRHLQSAAAAVKAAAPDAEAAEHALIELGVEESRLRGWNDTYTMTKWLGEQMLYNHFGDSGRLTVVRPAIVESTLASPAPGWIEGVKVADALILAYARERVTFFPGRKKSVIDVIPADLVANGIITAAAELLTLTEGRRIYQVGSSHRNPVTINELVEHVSEEAQTNHAAHDRLFYRRPQRPFIVLPRPAFKMLLSGVSAGLRLKGVMRGISQNEQKKIEATNKLAMIFSFYTSPNYVFDMSQMLSLSKRLSADEQKLYPVDPASFDWQHYMRNVHIPGLNRYALKPRKPDKTVSGESLTELNLSAAG
ncbi:fatty acyl-CoA reductase [Allohahella marinimesophila]|uniref:Male sterility protein n=1 Tax=Allohahella marinimesophila TaxID=1054972 RepID=A0ABP7NQN5_9GAMM